MVKVSPEDDEESAVQTGRRDGFQAEGTAREAHRGTDEHSLSGTLMESGC